ncbi:MAG TPA: hypothetical protein VGK48_13700 [Terriglobia bacterium]|jgi:hypothetical protein
MSESAGSKRGLNTPTAIGSGDCGNAAVASKIFFAQLRSHSMPPQSIARILVFRSDPVTLAAQCSGDSR